MDNLPIFPPYQILVLMQLWCLACGKYREAPIPSSLLFPHEIPRLTLGLQVLCCIFSSRIRESVSTCWLLSPSCALATLLTMKTGLTWGAPLLEEPPFPSSCIYYLGSLPSYFIRESLLTSNRNILFSYEIRFPVNFQQHHESAIGILIIS